MEKMDKQTFMRRCMSDMAKKKRERVQKKKVKDVDFLGYSIANHTRIVRRCGNRGRK